MTPQPQRPGARDFVIPNTGPRRIARQRRFGTQNGSDQNQRATKIARVQQALQRAENFSLADGTKITHKSQMAYWREFCDLFGVEPTEFACLLPGETHASLEAIKKEEDTLAAFMAFVVSCPRKGTNANTASYALQCISTVRSYYALQSGRRPGLRNGNRTGGRLRYVISGFQKTHPSRKQTRIPILQQHLRGIRGRLDLINNTYHKALWALWLTQWQGVLRSSDLIKRARDAARPWTPGRKHTGEG